MTPKEKAEKLVNSFIGLSSNKLSDYSRIEHPTAKQCAILVVDEILNNVMRWWELPSEDEYFIIQKTYWKEVRSEIEKM